MTGSESKVGYMQTFLMQKIKANTAFINSTIIKITEALVIIKNKHHHFYFFRLHRITFQSIYMWILTLFPWVWHLFSV